jgi:DnaK suppressor protein
VNAADLQRYKRLLLAKLEEFSSKKAAATSLAPAATPHGDIIDQATADADADLYVRLHESDVDLIRAIEEALARITREQFGVCDVCNSPISKARLEAIPWTRLCRDCEEREQSAA